jgi:HlyD family secretion protein
MMRTSTIGALIALAAISACDRGESPDRARASGYVEATEVRVSAKIAGRVEEVHVREGTRVAAGELLVRLATTDIDHALDRARAERRQADAQWRLLRAGARPEDISQAEAQRAAADADRLAAQAELDAAAADEARFTQLVERRAGSVKQRDDASTRRALAQARVKAAGDRAAAAAATLARVQAGARPEELEAARARVAAVDAQITGLERDKAEAVITAPTAGVVMSRLVEPGELAAPGAPVAILVDLDRAWVNAYVEEPLVPGLTLDQRLVVVTDAGDRIDGRVAFVSPRAEFTPRNVQTTAERARLVYRVKVTVDNKAGILKPGMPVEVEWP